MIGDWANDPRKQLPKLSENFGSAFLTIHNKSIIVGGVTMFSDVFKCLKLYHGSWKEHSILNETRIWASEVTTDIATFVFGGIAIPPLNTNGRSFEYLPNESTSWKVGTSHIPIWFEQGCAMAIPSDKYIWLIGGVCSMRSIIKFNIYTHTFQILTLKLMEGRYRHSCIVIPSTGKILITGGSTTGSLTVGLPYLNSTEILDTENETIVRGPPMNVSREKHGIGVITINGRDSIVVFGGIGTSKGRCLDSVEVYDTETQKWTLTDLKMKKATVFEGNLCVKGKTISDFLG